MPDVQVSNARRVVFTAMAVVTFWILAWKCYAIFSELPDDELFWLHYARDYSWSWIALEWQCPSWTVTIPLASLPTMLVSLSAHNSLVRLRDPWVFLSAAFFLGCMMLVCWLGSQDALSAQDAWFEAHPLWRVNDAGLLFEDHDRPNPNPRSLQEVSWFRLLLPIILTTAFVIYGAWRRAVRDAEVDAVGEDR